MNELKQREYVLGILWLSPLSNRICLYMRTQTLRFSFSFISYEKFLMRLFSVLHEKSVRVKLRMWWEWEGTRFRDVAKSRFSVFNILHLNKSIAFAASCFSIENHSNVLYYTIFAEEIFQILVCFIFSQIGWFKEEETMSMLFKEIRFFVYCFHD